MDGTTELWEPWKPEIGQRVRIRVSGECQKEWPVAGWQSGHEKRLDGMTGTVSSCDHWTEQPCQFGEDHRIFVLFDRGIVVQRPVSPWPTEIVGGHFAVLELDPMEEEHDPS